MRKTTLALPVEGQRILPWATDTTQAVRGLLRTRPGPSRWPRRATAQRRVPWDVRLDSYFEGSNGEITGVKLIAELDSWLMKGTTWDAKQTVSGLGEAFEIQPEEKVWLQVNLEESGLIESATIEHGETGEEEVWPDFPNPIAYDDSEDPERAQTKYYHLLAWFMEVDENYPYEVIHFPDDESKMLRTTTFGSHLIACWKCFEEDGERVRMLDPWFAPFLESTT